MALRWGILGAGFISGDFCVGFSTLPPEEHQLIAVGARNIEDAKNFAKDQNIAKYYGSYEELIQDPEIDIIYIANISARHYPWAKVCLENGKHVLCEKPLCVNVKETKDLVAYAKKKNKFLMEAIWSRHFPAYRKLAEELKTDIIGNVLQVIVPFGIPSNTGYKLKPRLNGAGTMLDFGIYCVQLASLVYGGEKPELIRSAGHLNEDGVDASTSSTVIYSKGRTATLITHSSAELSNDATIIGTKGTIKVCFPFWCPNKLETPNGMYEFEIPKAAKKPALLHSEGLSYQCKEARRCILSGLIESPIVSHDESVTIAEIVEDIRKQIGVVYPADEELLSDQQKKLVYGIIPPTD